MSIIVKNLYIMVSLKIIIIIIIIIILFIIFYLSLFL